MCCIEEGLTWGMQRMAYAIDANIPLSGNMEGLISLPLSSLLVCVSATYTLCR
jgi:hypothetical protein